MSTKHQTSGQKLAAILEAIRIHRVCAYRGSRCDCKFGADRIFDEWGHESGNGCPEMRDAIHLLNNMTDAEYRRIRDRKEPGHFFDALSR